MTSADAPRLDGQEKSAYWAAGFVVLLAALCGLFYYKWGGAIRTVSGVRALGRWSGTAEGLTTGGVLRESLFYLRRIWIALVYGLLIGAAVRAFVSPRRVAELLGWGGRVRRQLAGGLVGTPLMLCSCCITPIFQSVYERGARLRSALAVMLASPGLNPAALLLTALLFPPTLAVARVAAALTAVFGLAPLVERTAGKGLVKDGRFGAVTDDAGPYSARDVVVRFARALGHLTLQTVPLIVAGVLLSSLILPRAVELSSGAGVLAVIVIAAVGVVVALPTFFEIPLGMLFLGLGAPGAAAAILVAGPLVNLPSLLILARETRPRVAIAVALGVWVLAVAAGLAAA